MELRLCSSVKKLAKSVLPIPAQVVARWIIAQAQSPLMSKRALRRQAFQDVYENNLWGIDGNSKYFSGAGSRGEAAETYVNRMAELLKRHVVEIGRPITVVDLGCGDFQIGRALTAKLPDLNYLGCDIVPEIIAYNTKMYAGSRIKFRQLDMVADSLPEGDVYLVRQVLQHLSNADIVSFLGHVNCKYLYVTEGHPAERVGPANPDHVAGASVRFDYCSGVGRGVELDQPPYGLTTREIFRAFSPPHEFIVTDLVVLAEEPSLSHSAAQDPGRRY
jgi:O-methyltransferase domain